MPVPWIILVALLWIVVIALAVVVLGLHQRLAALQAASGAGFTPGFTQALGDAIAVGAPLPYQEELLGQMPGRGRTVLLFLRSGCAPCHALAEKLAAVRDPANPGILDAADELVVITNNAEEALALSDIGRVVIDEDDRVTLAVGVNSTPAGLSVDRDGIVCAKALLGSIEDVRHLAESCADEPEPAAAPAGAAASDVPSALGAGSNHSRAVTR